MKIKKYCGKITNNKAEQNLKLLYVIPFLELFRITLKQENNIDAALLVFALEK